MSRLKISENLFLEVNELKKMFSFLSDEGYKLALRSLIRNYGVVNNGDNDFFKVSKKTDSLNRVTVNAGIAFDSNMNAIIAKEQFELEVPYSNTNQWLILSHDITNEEEGSVSIHPDGTLTGVGTKFTEVLRGQPDFPTKVKLSGIDGEFEVVSVVSDDSAVLSGMTYSLSNLKYSVVGTFTPGFQPLSENKQIYEYDSYRVILVESSEQPIINSDEFIIARFNFNEVTRAVSVEDLRKFCTFNGSDSGEYGDGFINPIANLKRVSLVGGVKSLDTISAEIELIFEHGYNVSEFKFISDENSNLFTIVSGNNGFLGTGNIPNDLFNGWLLINKKNMRRVEISKNVNKDIYINSFDPFLIGEENDFIIVPNFKEVEYEVYLSNSVYDSAIPFHFKASNSLSQIRTRVYVLFDEEDRVTISMKNRMVGSEVENSFEDLKLTQFININGEVETLSESSFDIDLSLIEPQYKQRNYS